ncbi:acyl-CoA N-acyltransferase [Blastocladiella britannica]|nr:acyl-CoA N-acyltransferase [Blastocladiella britannica]
MITLELVGSTAVPPPLGQTHGDDDDEDNGATPKASHHNNTNRVAFHPVYTYPFYGETEELVGYKNPRITLRYSAGSLATQLVSSYDEKNETEATVDLVAPLLEYLPPDLIHDDAAFAAAVSADASPTFAPPGVLVHQYTLPGLANCNDRYEVYASGFGAPGFLALYKRLAILFMFYIEAATPVDDTDPHWNFLCVYRRRSLSSATTAASAAPAATCELVAAMSVYSFYQFPSQLRRRLAQLMVLPPYQRRGHALAMYSYLLSWVVSDPEAGALTVEDPSDAMDVVRDLGDLTLLVSRTNVWRLAGIPQPSISTIEPTLVGTAAGAVTAATADMLCAFGAKRAALTTLRCEYKLAARQAERVYEMLVLRELEGRAPRPFRLMVKARIFRANRDALATVEDKYERVSAIQGTYKDVLSEYKDRLRKFKTSAAGAGTDDQ